MRDYVALAVAYAKDAVSKKPQRAYNKWMTLAAQRFLDDLQKARGPNPPFVFDDWHANDPCDFIEKLPHVEGIWSQPTIELHISDIFFIVNLFGFRNADGHRRFTSALKAIARKNAKSTIAASIGLYCQNCEGENGPQVLTAATTSAQAHIVFNIAKRMTELTPELVEAFRLEPRMHSILSRENGGIFRPINAKASTQDGLNPSTVILDEIHAQKSHDLLNVLRSAAGARSNPLFLYTTTEGYESPGPWPELRKFAEQVLENKVDAEHFLAVIYCIDEDDDDFDEAAWIKANPLMEVNPLLLKELRKEAIEAKAMPSKLAEFRIKRLNRRSSTANGWIQFREWQRCATPVDLSWDKLRSAKCYGGLDLASTRDLAAFRLVWEIDSELYTAGLRWVPHDSVNTRSDLGMIPYRAWVNAGHLRTTPGNVLDYDLMLEDIIEFAGQFNVHEIAYDPWNAAQAAKKLSKHFTMKQFIQGPKSYHPAMKAFESYYMQGKLHYGEDPVLTWCASNMVVRLDANLNMAPDKKRSAEKIDDLTALLMAVGTMADPGNKQPEYKLLFLR